MKVSIIGSRSFSDKELLNQEMDRLHEEFVITDVISGLADGADTLGKEWAEERSINVIEKPAKWNLTKSAGMFRNTNIVLDADLVVAFWDTKSKGTLDSLKKCKEFGKRYKVIKVNS